MMTLADAHIHLFRHGFRGRYGRPSSGGDDVAVYESLREQHGIARALVVGFEGGEQYVGNNDDIADLAVRHEWIAPVAYLPPWPPPRSDDLERLARRGFCGVALWLRTADAVQQLSGWPPEVVDRIAQIFRVVSLNVGPEQTAGLARMVRDLAPCTVLFSHLGLPCRYPQPPSPLDATERLAPLLDLASLDHVGVKLSGLYAVGEPRHGYPHPQARPFLDCLVERFGAGRIYWGSDFSPSLDWVSFAQAVDVGVPDVVTDEDRSAVMGGNLMRLLNPDSARQATGGDRA